MEQHVPIIRQMAASFGRWQHHSADGSIIRQMAAATTTTRRVIHLDVMTIFKKQNRSTWNLDTSYNRDYFKQNSTDGVGWPGISNWFSSFAVIKINFMGRNQQLSKGLFCINTVLVYLGISVTFKSARISSEQISVLKLPPSVS